MIIPPIKPPIVPKQMEAPIGFAHIVRKFLLLLEDGFKFVLEAISGFLELEST